MTGYYKNQMSNNAVWAYSQGEKLCISGLKPLF